MNTNTDAQTSFAAWKAANKDMYSKEARHAYFHKDKTEATK